MTFKFIEESTPVAQKKYQCQAADWIENMADFDEFSPDDIAEWEKAKANKFKILPGDRYVKITGTYDGEIRVFRAIPELHAICLKHKLYECD